MNSLQWDMGENNATALISTVYLQGSASPAAVAFGIREKVTSLPRISSSLCSETATGFSKELTGFIQQQGSLQLAWSVFPSNAVHILSSRQGCFADTQFVLGIFFS